MEDIYRRSTQAIVYLGPRAGTSATEGTDPRYSMDWDIGIDLLHRLGRERKRLRQTYVNNKFQRITPPELERLPVWKAMPGVLQRPW
ncbi:hypothetical protein GGR56DRAFT_662080 [Xylariaceae sp. FL0804]|nr:hypothetical protein GGR56DRAFT_662080 [Xylariaceae sp. FL0804]